MMDDLADFLANGGESRKPFDSLKVKQELTARRLPHDNMLKPQMEGTIHSLIPRKLKCAIIIIIT